MQHPFFQLDIVLDDAIRYANNVDTQT